MYKIKNTKLFSESRISIYTKSFIRNYTLVGVDSTFDLMKTDFGEYGEVNKAWTADDVKGFTKILGNQIKIFYNVQKRNKK